MKSIKDKGCRSGLCLPVIALAAVLQAGCGASLNSDGVAALGSDAAGSSDIQDRSPAAPLAAGSESAVAVTPIRSETATGPVPSSANVSGPKAGLAAAAAAGSSAPSPGYKIGAQDVLDISVFKVPELSKTIQVSDSGTVNLPLVGELQAVGRTSQEIERELTQKLGAKYLQSPQVTVFVKEFNSQRVTIDGAVAKPGVFPYRSSISLLQAITMAGGLDKNSDSTVVVFRTVNGKRNGARFDVSQIRDGQAPDPTIEPGDVVVVGTSAIKEAVNNVLKVLPAAGLFMGL